MAQLPRVLRYFMSADRPTKGWPDCRGIGGRFAVEWVAGLAWNQWPVCRGIGGRFRVELVATLPWNTQASARRLMPVPDIEIRVLAKDKHAELSKHINTVPIVAAGSALTFSIMHPHAVPEFSTVEWTVRYCGVDPNMDGLLGQRKSGAALLSTTEHADREGPFSMDCVIRVSGSVYAVRRVPFHVGNSALPARSPLAETTVIRPSLASTWT